MDLGGNGGRGGDSGVGVRAGIAARTDDNANDERGTGSGGEGSKSHAESGGKKSEPKNSDRSGTGAGEGFRSVSVLDRHGGPQRQRGGRRHAVSVR